MDIIFYSETHWVITFWEIYAQSQTITRLPPRDKID